MKYCQRCNKPLSDGEYDEVDTERPTGPGSTIYICKDWCKPVPTQTAPVSRGSIRGR